MAESRKVRMLVVGGKRHLVELMQEPFAGTEFEVLPCWDKVVGLELLRNGSIDFIAAEAFMDSGLVLDLIREARAMPQHALTPIMIVAAEPTPKGHTLIQTTARAAELVGADKFIVMPHFDTERLLAEARTLLQQRRNSQ